MAQSSSATRACDALTFASVGTSESARQQILLDAAAVSPGNFVFAGYTASMTGGAQTAVTVNVRIYDAATSGNRIYQDNPVFAASGNAAGDTNVRKPYNRSAIAGLWATCEASAGADTNITLLCDVAPVLDR
jgi:hypothetical protein